MTNAYPMNPQTVASVTAQLTFNADGLIPAIAQQADTGLILMMAWMNADAIIETLTTGRVCYFSRSRNKLWRKGERSGQVQMLTDFRWDCDTDTVLLQVHQKGVACHTGRRTCFFNAVRGGQLDVIEDIQVDPDTLYRG